MVRFGPAGTVDQFEALFGPFSSGEAELNDIRVTADGRVTGFGRFDPDARFNYYGPDDMPLNFGTRDVIVRWDADGTLDRSFGAGDDVGEGFVLTEGARVGDLDAAGRPVAAGWLETVDDVPTTARVQRRLAGGTDPAGIYKSPRGLLAIEGTTYNDQIYVTESNGQVRVLARGVVRTYPRSAVQAIVVDGAGGNDTIRVDAFDIGGTIRGGAGNDTLTGGKGSDKIFGDAGNDVIRGLGAEDYIEGGAGDDTIDGGLGADRMSGGAYNWNGYSSPDGYDTLTYAGRTKAVRVFLTDNENGRSGEAGEGDEVDDFRVVVGGSGNDTLKAYPFENAQPVRLIGGAGDDVLIGGDAADTLDGGPGRDRLYGLAGNDLLLGKDGFVDYLDGGTGIDKAIKDAVDATFAVEAVG